MRRQCCPCVQVERRDPFVLRWVAFPRLSPRQSAPKATLSLRDRLPGAPPDGAPPDGGVVGSSPSGVAFSLAIASLSMRLRLFNDA